MAGVPYYRIQNCCTSQSTLINLDPSGLSDGIYKWTGTQTILPSGFILDPDNCYIITSQGSVFNTYDVVDSSFLTLDTLGTFTDCNSATTDCDCDPPSGTHYIIAEPCCGGDTIYFRGEGYTGVEQVEGDIKGKSEFSPALPIVDLNNFQGVYLFNGACYTVSFGTVGDGIIPDMDTYNTLPFPPPASELEFVHESDCEYQDGKIQCPDCEPICYRLTSCSGITINTLIDLSAYVGTYITIENYTETWYVELNEAICQNPTLILKVTATEQDPCPCICYEVLGNTGGINYIDCNGNRQFTYSPAKFCAQAPPVIAQIQGEDYQLIVGGDCVDGQCPAECFYLKNCDPEKYPEQEPIIFSNLQSLSQYANTSSVVELNNYQGCWEVFPAECTCITVSFQLGGDAFRQYDAYLEYIDSNGFNVYSFVIPSQIPGGDPYTYYIWFDSASFIWVVSQTVGDRDNALATYETKGTEIPCPAPVSNLIWEDGIGPNLEIVNGFFSDLCDEQCKCPVDVIVLRDYESCFECLPTIAYKLTSCSNPLVNTYTTQDLSAYVDKVIKDDCDCYTVQEINYQPPIDTPITIEQTYDDCETCLATLFLLTDCNDPERTIVTDTNLTVYLGQYVKIKNCEGCFFVESYTLVPEFIEAVEVEENYDTCFACNQVLPRCSTVFNNSTEDRTFTFINANGDPEETAIVKSGHFSLRYCVQTWEESDTFIYNYYGDCTIYEDEFGVKTGFCVQYFPNSRKVKPGYNTPICSAEKYDKITCKFADIVYKKVLELRYGISNCCPEEDEKWLVKKELIELQALTDPNYKCEPLKDCCGNTASNCSCNS